MVDSLDVLVDEVARVGELGRGPCLVVDVCERRGVQFLTLAACDDELMGRVQVAVGLALRKVGGRGG